MRTIDIKMKNICWERCQHVRVPSRAGLPENENHQIAILPNLSSHNIMSKMCLCFSRVFVAHTHKGMGSCAQGPRQILHLPWRITMSWNTWRESSKEIKYPKVNQLPRFSVFYTSTLSKFLPSRSTAPACNQFEEEHDVRSELETWNLTHANSEIGHLTSDKQPEHCAK